MLKWSLLKWAVGPVLIVLFGLAFLFVNDGKKNVRLFKELENTSFHSFFLVPQPEEKTKVRIQVIIHAGEIDNSGPEGLAHYTEHLVWFHVFGSKLNGVDPRGNAWTNSVATSYYLDSNKTSWVQDLRHLLKIFEPIQVTAQFADEERNVVEREYEVRIVENPDYSLATHFDEVALDDSPWARSVLGNRQSIKNFDLSTASAFQKENYKYSNASVIISGNISEEVLHKEISRILPSKPITAVRPIHSYDIPHEPLRDVGSFPTGIALSNPIVWYQGSTPSKECKSQAECFVVSRLVDQLLNSSLEGGVVTPLKYDDFVVKSFRISTYRDPQGQVVIFFSGSPDDDKTNSDVLGVLENAIRSTARSGISNEVFERLISRYKSDLVSVNQPLVDQHRRLLDATVNRRRFFSLHEELTTVRNVTREDVNNYLRLIANPNRVIIRFANPNGEVDD